jgi:hypothetical protein
MFIVLSDKTFDGQLRPLEATVTVFADVPDNLLLGFG